MPGRDLQAKMAALKADYHAKLPDKIRDIRDAWEQAQQDWNESNLRVVILKAHTLRGGALSFGLPTLGERAGVLEDQIIALSQDCQPNARQLTDVDYLIEQLEASLDPKPQTPTPTTVHPSEGKGLIYLIDDDDNFIASLSEKLHQQGFQSQRLHDLKALPEAIRRHPPAALFVDITLQVQGQPCTALLSRVQQIYQCRFPVVFASNRDDLSLRMAAVRAGGRAYLLRPVLVQHAVDVLSKITLPETTSTHRVLIVDEPGITGGRYLSLLREADIQCRLLRDALAFPRIWQEFLPTVVLMAGQQSNVNSVDFLTALRQQAHYRHLPIILFTDGIDETVQQISQQGLVDALISQDLSAEALISTLINQTKNTARLLEEVRLHPHRDPLTHCLNRQGLMARLEQEEYRAQSPTPLVVMAIRLLNCPEVDRRFGFEAGDRMRQDVVSLLHRSLEASDTLARFSDGLFIVLSVQRTLKATRQLADELRQTLEQWRLVGTGRTLIHPRCAIGIGVFDRATASPQQTLINALSASDTPELRATGGVGLHQAGATLQRDLQHQAEWQVRLTEALAEQRLFLTFQPIASLHGEPHHYYDVFVRMNGDVPEETIPAAEFIPIAEQSGLIGELDRWVIQQAVEILASRIRQGGEHASLFIRLSGQSLSDDDFLTWIGLQLQEHQLPGNVLHLTLSAGEIDRQLESLRHFAGRVRALDCRVGLADVYNDPRVFQAIKRLPLSFIKIPVQIIGGLRRDREAVRQLRAICHRAKGQGLTIIAPCVEDAESLNVLWSNGVDYIEGFFIHPPELSLNYDFGAS